MSSSTAISRPPLDDPKPRDGPGSERFSRVLAQTGTASERLSGSGRGLRGDGVRASAPLHLGRLQGFTPARLLSGIQGLSTRAPFLTALAPLQVLHRHQLAVSHQREARHEGLLGDLERVLDRSTALDRGERERREHARDLLRSEPPSHGPARPLPQLPEARLSSGPAPELAGTALRTPSAGSSENLSPPERSRSLIALVERIEACVRQGRPALSLQLTGTGWTVDLERHALGGVVVRVRTPHGGHGPDATALREALQQRGVMLRELSIASGPMGS